MVIGLGTYHGTGWDLPRFSSSSRDSIIRGYSEPAKKEKKPNYFMIEQHNKEIRQAWKNRAHFVPLKCQIRM